jgi:predicted 3-demethylubiquinone-9 3-methyltransferase (glyoxalase superfamily)
MSSITPSKVTPFLIFTGRAEEALASTEYGFAAEYAWPSDRVGVSWQLSLGLGFGGGR